MPVSTFRDLVAWQEAMQLVEDVYALSATLPREERFGLAAQMKRAVISIPSNIAEGARRRRRLTLRYHLEGALGSQGEVEVQLEIAHGLGFIDEAQFAAVSQRAETVGRLLTRLIESI